MLLSSGNNCSPSEEVSYEAQSQKGHSPSSGETVQSGPESLPPPLVGGLLFPDPLPASVLQAPRFLAQQCSVQASKVKQENLMGLKTPGPRHTAMETRPRVLKAHFRGVKGQHTN